VQICSRALSPSTPGSLANALTRCFFANSWLHPFRQTGHFRYSHEADFGFACTTAHVFASPGFAFQDYSLRRRFGYMSNG
jgi:hypothetical protein